MFLEPTETQFDLNWRMFGTHVRVHPLFWLLAAILGWDLVRIPGRGMSYLILWVLCVFISILLHEFGHVFAGRLFGSDGHIVLYSLGGLAISSSNLASRWQRIVVYLAGPAVQLLLYGLLVLVGWPDRAFMDSPATTDLTWRGYWFLRDINLYWPLLNLLPLWPLDGGRVCRELAEWLSPRRGTRVSLALSFGLAALLAVFFILPESMHDVPALPWLPGRSSFNALLFAFLAAGSYMELQSLKPRPSSWQEERSDPWDRDREDWR